MKYDIFISYSRKDTAVVKKFAEKFGTAGYRYWMDVDGVEIGDEFKRKIVSAIKDSKVFLFFSSEASNSSPWTVKEVNVAVMLRKPIIPIRLDNAVYDDSLLFDLVGLDFIECSSDDRISSGIQKLMRSLKNKTNSCNNGNFDGMTVENDNTGQGCSKDIDDAMLLLGGENGIEIGKPDGVDDCPPVLSETSAEDGVSEPPVTDVGGTVVGNPANPVIFRGKPSTTRLSASEESQSASSAISSGSDKSHKHANKEILRVAQNDKHADEEILHSVQNDNGGNGRQNDKHTDAADDGATVVENLANLVIFRGKPSTTRLSASEESQSASSVISSDSEKSHKHADEEILRVAQNDKHANREILHSVQNDNGGKEKGESRMEKGENSGGTSKKRWAIIIAVLVIGAAGALFGTMSGGGSGSDDTAAERERLTTRTFTVNGVSFKMVAVEGGTFKMGATSEQQDPYDDEKPVHNVTLSDYSIGETEVTQALWEAVMGSNPSYFTGSNNPVEQVSYEDCITFINKLNSQLSGQLPAGRKFRLPTEAEWEYAARGSNRSRGYQYSGSNSLGSVAWYGDNSNSKTHPVKQKQANELGLYDMSGNVYEWCYDWYGSYSSSSQTNPKGPSSGSFRVLRGGSWDYGAQICRVAFRYGSTPGNRNYCSGLRLAL